MPHGAGTVLRLLQACKSKADRQGTFVRDYPRWAKEFGVAAGTIKVLLNRLVDRGSVERIGGAIYRVTGVPYEPAPVRRELLEGRRKPREQAAAPVARDASLTAADRAQMKVLAVSGRKLTEIVAVVRKPYRAVAAEMERMGLLHRRPLLVVGASP